MTEKWDKRFIELAKHVAGWSRDESTKCGAVVVKDKRIVSTGFNGFPRNTDDSPKLYEDREEKLLRVLHAEINALLYAKEPLEGCTCYVHPMPPCSQCAAALIQAGITRVVSIEPTGMLQGRWSHSHRVATQMFKEAGVELVYCGEQQEESKP